MKGFVEENKPNEKQAQQKEQPKKTFK
jgi:hypothetical protein